MDKEVTAALQYCKDYISIQNMTDTKISQLFIVFITTTFIFIRQFRFEQDHYLGMHRCILYILRWSE